MTGERSAAIAAHGETVCEWARDGGPLSPASKSATISNSQWFVRTPDGVHHPRARRKELQDCLVTAYRNLFSDVCTEKKTIILAGPPGATEAACGLDQCGTAEATALGAIYAEHLTDIEGAHR